MALKLGELTVDIGADTSDLKRAGKEVKKTAGSMEKSFKRVGSAIVAALSFQAIKSVFLLADNMNMLDSRIRNVTKSAKEFAIVRKGIREIAKETGNSIQSITTLAQNLLIAGESIGASSEQIVQMTSNLNKLGSIGGSSAEQMGNAMLQFGQAMAGGIVRAEEFNSIVENTPLIAQAIAKGMGLTVGELRKAVIEGTVLSEDVFAALEGQTDAINKKFAAMPLTIQRASGMIANAFAVAVQEIDKGVGSTEAIADFMKEISEIIESDLVPAFDNVIDNISDFLFMLDQLTAGAQSAADETFDLARSWEIVKNALSFIAQTIINLPANLSAITTIIVGEVSQAFINLAATANIVWLNISNGFKNAMFSAINKVKAAFNELNANAQDSFGQLFKFIGADEVAQSFANASEASKQTAADLTEFNEEQLIIRQDQLLAEIEAINANTEIKIMASNMAIQAGLDETEALKQQTAERRKLRERERKIKRKAAATGAKNSENEVKIEQKTSETKKNIRLKQEQSVANSLGAIFGLEKEAAIASATLGLQSAIAKALAQKGALAFGDIAIITAQFASLFSAIKGIKGGGRQAGGNVSQGVLHPVNENGQPELLIQGSKQFLLSGQSGGQIIPATSMQSGGGNGGMNVIINNNASDLVEIGEPFVTQGELTISINRAVSQAVDQVNASLASGRGESSDSLRQGFNLTRNI